VRGGEKEAEVEDDLSDLAHQAPPKSQLAGFCSLFSLLSVSTVNLIEKGFSLLSDVRELA